MVRRIVLIFGYLFFSLATVYAANVPEKITISAYYPSATGAYNTVTLATIANPGDCSGGTPPLGKMYYNSTDNSLYICNNCSEGLSLK